MDNRHLVCEGHPLKFFGRTLELHLTEKIMLEQVVHHQPRLGGDYNIRSIQGPMGSAITTSSASPIRGGVAPKGKRITRCRESMMGMVNPTTPAPTPL